MQRAQSAQWKFRGKGTIKLYPFPLLLCRRLAGPALVCRRWYHLCLSGELSQDLSVSLADGQTSLLPRLRSLLTWLVRHAAAPRSITLRLWHGDAGAAAPAPQSAESAAEVVALLNRWARLAAAQQTAAAAASSGRKALQGGTTACTRYPMACMGCTLSRALRSLRTRGQPCPPARFRLQLRHRLLVC